MTVKYLWAEIPMYNNSNVVFIADYYVSLFSFFLPLPPPPPPPPSSSGEKILQAARQQVETAGISSSTGLHDPDVAEPPPLTPSTIAKTVSLPEDILDNGNTHCGNFCCRVREWYIKKS